MTENKNDIKKKSFSDCFVAHKELVTLIIGICAFVYPIINFFYNIIYKIECEEFYRIPGRYFESNINNRLLYFACIIMLLVLCICPLLMKKIEKNGSTSSTWNNGMVIVLSVCIGMEIGIFNAYNLITIMKAAYQINGFIQIMNDFFNEHVNLTLLIIVFMGIASVLGITMMDILKKIKHTFWNKMAKILFFISLTVSLLLMFYGSKLKLSISIENITKYEFVQYNQLEYIVLSHYDDKILVVPYEINEDGQYKFITAHYMFKDPYEGFYYYKDIKSSPIINVSE